MLSTRRSGRDSLVQQVLLLEARVIPLSVVVSVQPLNTRYASPASEGDHPDAFCCLLSYQSSSSGSAHIPRWYGGGASRRAARRRGAADGEGVPGRLLIIGLFF